MYDLMGAVLRRREHICSDVKNENTIMPQYLPGDWVETIDNDMIWTLEQVVKVLKVPPDEWDWNDPHNFGKEPIWEFYYHTTSTRMIKPKLIRSSESGLRCIFGARPWVWQQFALLKLENAIRFHKGHQNDFMKMDILTYASELWESWLHDERNKDFKAIFDHNIGEGTRMQLLKHIMSPFELIENLHEIENDEWNVADAKNVSVYTYLSIMGDGLITPLVIMILQVFIPIILTLDTIDKNQDGHAAETIYNQEATLMKFLIFLFYLFNIVPDAVSTAESVYSRLCSLQRVLLQQEDCTLLQKIGGRLDFIMNTSYVCVLYLLNMYILANTEDANDVLFNALQIHFVLVMDEAVASSLWWDPNKRWIKAGVTELLLQINLRLCWLASVDDFSKNFDIPKQDLLIACDGDYNLFQNRQVAIESATYTRFMTTGERVSFFFLQEAIEMKNARAVSEYRKPMPHFGSFPFMHGSFRRGVFDKYEDLRTWRRWEKVLWLAPIPNLTNIIHVNEMSEIVPNLELKKIKATSHRPFANQGDVYKKLTYITHLRDVLTFKKLYRDLHDSWSQQNLLRFITTACDGVLDW
eukprot:CAMPEP_0194394696 /NCGR_PEP_ID=MMETSP0174-20130528/123998_1 /TAXON_ID=216777 /ORGANISM="Proboscia alata, Strain PI-D3" /LENGTH=581 /DNA_ID=CAMNT_0039190523 /DNA_START=1347 /DNA_END=3089 /DNA_ORIENTATION=-